MSRALGVIPARFQSSRFPGKPLAPLGDASMIEVVWRRVTACNALARTIVATDDERIERAARAFGAETMMTSPDHPSGTDRTAEVVRRLDESFDVVVNVQGDEPLVTPAAVGSLVAALADRAGDDGAMATLAEPLDDADELADPNVVKLVAAADGTALYFSRAAIPHLRDPSGSVAGVYRKHQGVYAYTPAALARLTALPPSPLERAERLEQLRALEHGFRIAVVDSDFRSHGVDTPRDLELVARALGLAEAT